MREQFMALSRVSGVDVKISVVGNEIHIQQATTSVERLKQAGTRWVSSDSRVVTAQFISSLVSEAVEYVDLLPKEEKNSIETLAAAMSQAVAGIRFLHKQYIKSPDNTPIKLEIAVKELERALKTFGYSFQPTSATGDTSTLYTQATAQHQPEAAQEPLSQTELPPLLPDE